MARNFVFKLFINITQFVSILIVGLDIVIDVNVVIEGTVSIGSNVSIGPNCIIKNSQIDEKIRLFLQILWSF